MDRSGWSTLATAAVSGVASALAVCFGALNGGNEELRARTSAAFLRSLRADRRGERSVAG